MTLVIADLLKDWPCTWLHGSFNEIICGVKENSKEIQAGDVFVVIKGKNANGATYINEAIENGAVCIIAEDREHEKMCREVAFGIVPNTRTFLSHACARVHGNPSKQLHVVAVTGTNGKTTVSHMIGQMLTMLGYQTAVIGTLGLFINGKKVDENFPSLTTWSASHLHQTFARLLKMNITHVIIEASSMGLAQHRLDHCSIQQGVFLNLGHDHLEDHEGIESYKKAKCKLMDISRKVVVNKDDSFWLEKGKECTKELNWFGEEFIQLKEIKPVSTNVTIFDEGDCDGYDVEVGFTGLYNISNIAAAIATIRQLDIPMSSIIPLLPNITLPPGRFQFILKKPFQVVIDYAHTPEALQHLLSSASRITEGRLLVVFGCGGNRDQAKRSAMGEIAAFYSHSMWVTSDNPRLEDPLKICQQIVGNLPETSKIHIEVDRAAAIQQALRYCKPGDLLCIAGKGHESTQHIGDQVIPFSDEQTVLLILSTLPMAGNHEK
ncbi:UDP-N-acetylmuramyl-tripeptide synthetase [Paenisporosarcina sp. HGH0030]|uniref:UDP-N-acetylmuramoyl-L-alanyl-D-glutamate--2, 6-diaminopimelate ligase n=1 Tax=Paenisporosarcina sp. HGH0030 TaxID=1078085 RepID=UPI00034E4E15|nr:UDP-N-acetylmuramoyl-L-alanyl-D-glutamate--2,6-diaminopimelate ligase [Paenisporosarcina sp. HGH0030]EPD52909.1 UDP-N-acetylmuramyl-tripeptide synthetase [Paenisporosarcina sp. HGH0030]